MKLKTDIEIKWLDQDEVRDYIEELHEHITTPDHWAESVKMADEMGLELKYWEGTYTLMDFDCPRWAVTQGPFTLPELHDKLISLRESEGE